MNWHSDSDDVICLERATAAAKRQFRNTAAAEEELGAEPKRRSFNFSGTSEERPPAGTIAVDAAQPTTASRKPHHFPVHPAPFIGRKVG
jgi:hypothetical protein